MPLDNDKRTAAVTEALRPGPSAMVGPPPPLSQLCQGGGRWRREGGANDSHIVRKVGACKHRRAAPEAGHEIELPLMFLVLLEERVVEDNRAGIGRDELARPQQDFPENLF